MTYKRCERGRWDLSILSPAEVHYTVVVDYKIAKEIIRKYKLVKQ